MNPFVSSHLKAMIEDIRLLEAFVTQPLGLFSDIKMLRESLTFPEAADLSRDELRERRTAYAALTDDAQALALDAIASLGKSIDILEAVRDDADVARLRDGWFSQGRRVLVRASAQVAGEIRAKLTAGIRGIYVIVDPEAMKGRDVVEVAGATLKGGASVLQLRDKSRDKGEVLPVARELRSLCDEHGALFIFNDDADLAVACGAHGLHVGQTDLPIGEARRVLAPNQIVGKSNSGIEEAMASQSDGADYLAVGAVYSTTTMGKSGRTAVGPEMISKVKELAQQPVVAIGGINETNIVDVVRAGADCVCVVSAITYADDPEAATSRLAEAIQNV
ncbi:MAG: thiamine phosphate synthase [Chloroflexi bacterium]|nr:thiamine phosphate synthase [Chloroflexota bacterium]